MFRVTWPQRKKLIQHIFRQIVLIQHILFSPYFVRKRERPQIRVRMQANDDNENEDGAVDTNLQYILNVKYFSVKKIKQNVLNQ